ncbi:MAG: hypothetical protein U0166_02940 [Acidobacteriota bacterium]
MSAISREVLDAAWHAGLQGKRIRIPARVDDRGKRAEIVRDLLGRAERRVVETGDVRRESIRQAWGSDREEAAHFGVAHSLIWRAARDAEAEILRWWRGGERDRQQRLRNMRDAGGEMSEYQTARREIRTESGDVPRFVRPEILTMALRSVQDAWWGRPSSPVEPELRLAEEAAYLALLMVDGRIDAAAVARVIGSKLGLTVERVADLMRHVEIGSERAARALARRHGEAA